jgi:uncharacterized protein (TIGR00725 family)
MPRVIVGVIGESRFSDPAHEAMAEEVGTGLARAGYAVVCGGLSGVMEAVCRGARTAGGLTIALLPGDDPSAANPHVDVAIPTGMGQARNSIIVLASRVVVAIGGGYGTLAEIGHALRLGRTVIGLRTWRAAMGGLEAPIRHAATAAEAVGLVVQELNG